MRTPISAPVHTLPLHLQYKDHTMNHARQDKVCGEAFFKYPQHVLYCIGKQYAQPNSFYTQAIA